jgi:hypothetical protein
LNQIKTEYKSSEGIIDQWTAKPSVIVNWEMVKLFLITQTEMEEVLQRYAQAMMETVNELIAKEQKNSEE